MNRRAWWIVGVFLAAAATVVIVLAVVRTSRGCPKLGCNDSIFIDLTDVPQIGTATELHVSLCVPGRECESSRVDGRNPQAAPGTATSPGSTLVVAFLGSSGRSPDLSSVELELSNAEGTLLYEGSLSGTPVTTERFSPSNDDCLPPCWIARLRASQTGELLPA